MEPVNSLIAGIAFGQFGAIISAIAALGTASFGLVDASKAFKGGISNVGYGFIKSALTPFEAALATIDRADPFALPRANWLNGLPTSDQKAAARNLIRLGFNSHTAERMAANVLPDNAVLLKAIAVKIETGEVPTEVELAVLARFDAIIDARLDSAFERADQKYRNTSRVAAAGISVVLAEAGAMSVYGSAGADVLLLGLIVGVIAVPVAPVAKDLASAISTSVAAFKTIKR
ncbi:hypothetical protein E2F50_20915 [Rhizobium deserti]|uniref:Uncharacterized protein n=1 Tax=Rhizobium deserti TaxID=2547961 RepID=A0A4R5U885_9HYPH|nr:hypothetical protein [Rhizobium deserti]TDK30302.1 hypothetical protein E2F50_20915 [Rhizobium deserti]